MTVKRLPYAIKSKNHRYTAELLQDLLDEAVAARLDGVAIAGITADNVPVLKLAGRLKSQPKEAYVLAAMLKNEVMKLLV